MAFHWGTMLSLLPLWLAARYFAHGFAQADGLPLPQWHSGLWLLPITILALYGATRTGGAAGVTYALLTGYLYLAALVDWWTGYIPDTAHLLALGGVICWQLYTGRFEWAPLWAGALVLGILALLSALFPDRIGGGDIKLFAVLICALSIGPGLYLLWLGYLLAFPVALYKRWRQTVEGGLRMGPFFLMALSLALLLPAPLLPDTLPLLRH